MVREKIPLRRGDCTGGQMLILQVAQKLCFAGILERFRASESPTRLSRRCAPLPAFGRGTPSSERERELTLRVRRRAPRKNRGSPLSSCVRDELASYCLGSLASLTIAFPRACCSVAPRVFWSSIDAAIPIVVTQVEGHPRLYRSTTPPVHSATCCNQLGYLLSQPLVLGAVTPGAGAGSSH